MAQLLLCHFKFQRIKAERKGFKVRSKLDIGYSRKLQEEE